MHRILTVVAVAIALGSLAACGASGSDASNDPTTTGAPKEVTTTTQAPVAVETWAASFCGSFDTWLAGIQTAGEGVADGVEVGDVASLQTAVADLYGSASNATQDLIADLRAAGTPDIDDGDQFVDDLVANFEAFDEAALDVRGQVEALPTDDIASFQAGIDGLGEDFQAEADKVSNSFAELDAAYPSPELSAALTKSCA